jgi:hypothetical protein
MYKNFVILSVIAAVYLISGLNIFACDWAKPQLIKDDKQFEAVLRKNYAQAVAVFTGEVISTNTKILGKKTVRFKIEKIWKGKVKNELEVSNGLRTLKVRTLKGGLSGRSSCDYLFESGEK